MKSLVFDCDGAPVVVLVPGDQRADSTKVARAAGCQRAKIAGPDYVRDATGFEPGAVAPFPLPKVSRVFVDRQLLVHERVWIGAGSPSHMATLADRPRPVVEGGADGRCRRGRLTFDPENRRRRMIAADKIWMNGELVDWGDAKVHVGAHGLHYGTGVFEGIRCYDTPRGPAVFRLTDHIKRLDASRQAPLHGHPILGRGSRRLPPGGRRQRPARVLSPALRVLRLRRLRRLHGGEPRRGRDHELAVVRTSATTG